MKSFTKATLNLYIYSSIHISIAAVCFALEIFFILDFEVHILFLEFVFCSTILTYSLHRVVGYDKLSEHMNTGRFVWINKYLLHIKLIAVISACLLIYLLFQMPFEMLIHFGISGFICFLYVLPVMHSKKRLRDLPYIKILFISVVWAYVACIPVLINEVLIAQNYTVVLLVTFEKILFIFLITLPFDIRDLDIDRSMNVKTLVHHFGNERSYSLIYKALVFDCLLWLAIIYYLNLSLSAFLLLLLSQVIIFLILKLSKNQNSDLYYSGLLDGAIIIRSLFVIAAFLIN